MAKFFNVLNEKETARIYLYGEVGEGERVDSLRVAQELEELEQQYKNIEIRINSNGGDVFAGVAIYNALKSSKADVKIYIDSVAASIAAIIALCGRPLFMAQHSKLMLHRVSGGVYGNAEDLRTTADTLEELEHDLSAMIADKCNLTPLEVQTRYFDGGEHWLSAEECLSLGLVDGLFNVSQSEVKQNESKFTNKKQDPATKQDPAEMVNKAIKVGLIDAAQRSAFLVLAKSDKTAFENYLTKAKTTQELNIKNEIRSNISGRAYYCEDFALLEEIGAEIGLNKLKKLLNLIRPFARVDAYLNNTPQPNWTLEDYRRHDPVFLLDNPEIYNQLKRKYGETKRVDLLDEYRKNRPEELAANPQLYADLVQRKFEN